MRPERRNAVKVLLFLDVGGSMDPHIKIVEELFSAAKTEFKHLEYFYFPPIYGLTHYLKNIGNTLTLLV